MMMEGRKLKAEKAFMILLMNLKKYLLRLSETGIKEGEGGNMDILIKGMEMPTSCYDCPLVDNECFGSIKCCYAKRWGSANMRAADCPLVPVPPHGRLIDADVTREEIDRMRPGRCYEDAWALTVMDNAPTIIPAEPPKEEE